MFETFHKTFRFSWFQTRHSLNTIFEMKNIRKIVFQDFILNFNYCYKDWHRTALLTTMVEKKTFLSLVFIIKSIQRNQLYSRSTLYKLCAFNWFTKIFSVRTENTKPLFADIPVFFHQNWKIFSCFMEMLTGFSGNYCFLLKFWRQKHTHGYISIWFSQWFGNANC